MERGAMPASEATLNGCWQQQQQQQPFVTIKHRSRRLGRNMTRSPCQMGCGGSVRSSACYTGATKVAVAETPAEAAAQHTARGDNTGDTLRYLSQLTRDRRNYAIQLAAFHGDMDVVRYLCELPRD